MATAPPSSAASASTSAQAAPATAKTGFDILRPFRYAKGFLGGTFDSTFNMMAGWGRKGSWLGLGLAALVVISGAPIVASGLGALVMGWVGGLVAGAVAGGSVGLLTGGVQGVNREMRRDKYSEDLLAKARASSRPAPSVDYRAAHRQHKARDAYNYDRLLHQEQEIREQTGSTYYQDMVSNSRNGNHERGY